MKRSPLKQSNKPLKRTPLKRKQGTIKKKAWQIFSKWIRERDKYKCFTCNKKATGSAMHAGHYIPRGLSSNLYFDPVNVNAQCYHCNINLFGNSDEYAQRIVLKYGWEELTRLRKAKSVKKSWSKEELNEIIEKYE